MGNYIEFRAAGKNRGWSSIFLGILEMNYPHMGVLGNVEYQYVIVLKKCNNHYRHLNPKCTLQMKIIFTSFLFFCTRGQLHNLLFSSA